MSFDLDYSIRPQDDFFHHVNYNWIKENPIPEDKPMSCSFMDLDENIKDQVKKIIENLPDTNPINILYKQGLEDKNKDMILPYVYKIKSTSNKEELKKAVFELFNVYGLNQPVIFNSGPDLSNSNFNILNILSSGLSLPNRDYYLDEDKEVIREEFKEFMKKYLDLFGFEFDVDKIYKIEEKLAENKLPKEDARDPNNRNNHHFYHDIKSKFSYIPIDEFFDHFIIPDRQFVKINVSEPKFFETLQHIWEETDLETLKKYYIWKLLLNTSSYLGEVVTQTKFDFYGQILSGVPNLQPLWKRVIQNINDKIGEMIGKEFVKVHFPEESKDKAKKMVEYIKDEVKNRLENNDWMTHETKNKALEKLSKMNFKLGYPDEWTDYSTLRVSHHFSYLENNLSCKKFNEEDEFSKIYKNKDPNEWFMNPHMVNAYYSPNNNEIVFPAGILQEPFFSVDYDMALNFGGIGCIIGHEITHGFDDQGRKFDSDGNLVDWWNETDATFYNNKTQKIKEQFSTYLIHGENVNGEFTLGENIADLGGVSISLEAFKNYLSKNPDKNVPIEGFTPLQRFFYNYARIWRTNIRKEEALKRLSVDPHSPPLYRVNGVLTNIKDFHETFNVMEGDNLWSKDKPSVW